MLTFDKFTGINNVEPAYRLGKTDLAAALDVEVGLTRELRRRDGYTVASEQCHKNLHQADGFMLATSGGQLVRTDGDTLEVLHPSLGNERLSFAQQER